jgi:hypothetical protein
MRKWALIKLRNPPIKNLKNVLHLYGLFVSIFNFFIWDKDTWAHFYLFNLIFFFFGPFSHIINGTWNYGHLVATKVEVTILLLFYYCNSLDFNFDLYN